MLHEEHGGNDEIVTIGLTHQDISTSIHGHYNYGIMGLSFRPGDACVVSTFRLKRKDDLWKVTIHEFLHSRGLPHCKTNAPKCLMQDAHEEYLLHETWVVRGLQELFGDDYDSLREIIQFSSTLSCLEYNPRHDFLIFLMRMLAFFF